MRIKPDGNMPSRLVGVLSSMGHDVDTVLVENLAGRPDEEAWDAAQAATRFLITQDLDFSDMRRFQPGTLWHFAGSSPQSRPQCSLRESKAALRTGGRGILDGLLRRGN